MNGLMEEYMCGDIWTWLQDTEVRVLRYWVYKRVFTPLEQEKKYVDQSEYEDTYCKKGIIRECVQHIKCVAAIYFVTLYIQNSPHSANFSNPPAERIYSRAVSTIS